MGPTYASLHAPSARGDVDHRSVFPFLIAELARQVEMSVVESERFAILPELLPTNAEVAEGRRLSCSVVDFFGDLERSLGACQRLWVILQFLIEQPEVAQGDRLEPAVPESDEGQGLRRWRQLQVVCPHRPEPVRRRSRGNLGWADAYDVPMILGRIDVFDRFDVTFKQRKAMTEFR